MAQKLIVRPLVVLSEALSSVPGCVTMYITPGTEDPMLSSHLHRYTQEVNIYM